MYHRAKSWMNMNDRNAWMAFKSIIQSMFVECLGISSKEVCVHLCIQTNWLLLYYGKKLWLLTTIVVTHRNYISIEFYAHPKAVFDCRTFLYSKQAFRTKMLYEHVHSYFGWYCENSCLCEEVTTPHSFINSSKCFFRI